MFPVGSTLKKSTFATVICKPLFIFLSKLLYIGCSKDMDNAAVPGG